MKEEFYKILSFILGIKLPRPTDNSANEVGMPHLLKENTDRLYEFSRDRVFELTGMANMSVARMRDVLNMTYLTAGTFLTVALPIIVSKDFVSINNMFVFWISTFSLFVSLIVGISAAYFEAKYDAIGIKDRKAAWELASMCVLTNEVDRAVNLMNSNRSEKLSGWKFWKAYFLVLLKRISIYLYLIGVVGVLISILREL